MKEYNENEAVALMAAVLPEELRDNDSICEVLDLIYDYYDENGELDLDLNDDDDDEQSDVDAIVAYIEKYFRKNAPSTRFSTEQIADMVKAEIEYENSLF